MTGVPALRHLRPALLVAGLAVVATSAALAFVLVVQHSSHVAPAVVARALGAADPSSSLDRRYAPKTSGAITATGVRVATRKGRVSMQLAGEKAHAWTRHANGADRPTSFGRESIVFEPRGVEELLTVSRAQGKRTLSRPSGSVTPFIR